MCSSMVNADFSAPTRRGGDGAVFSSGSDIKSNSCLVGLCLWDYQGKGPDDSINNQLREDAKSFVFILHRNGVFLGAVASRNTA
ncbi:conserved hypothetical protein [Xenorhabdus nematophila F1]|nr:conserved hypothetical protein [Xenorhabdus nematophila F1]